MKMESKMYLFDNIDRKRILLAISLIAIGTLGRISLHDFFNSINNPFTTNGFLDVFFIIAVISILSGILLGKYFVFIIPICVIILTDIYYAFIDTINYALWPSGLFLFTYSGFVFIALIGLYTKRKSDINIAFIPKLFGTSVISVILYDIWTNFGFWLTYSKLGFYPQNIQGLVTVFLGGIPFMIWHIISFSILLVIVLIPIVLVKDKLIMMENLNLNYSEKLYLTIATIFLISISIITSII